MLGVFVAAGWRVAQWRVSVRDGELRAELLRQAIDISRTINPQRVKALSFSASDIEKPEFQRLCGQMRAYGRILEVRGIYSMAVREGAIVFGPESFEPGDPLANPPGTVYGEPSAAHWEVFRTGRPSTVGPYRDEFGSFISALAPVLDSRSGEMLMAIRIDVEEVQWRAAIRREQWVVAAVVLVLALMLVGGGLVLRHRDRLPAERQARVRFSEYHLVACLGLALTVVVAKALNDTEGQSDREVFRHLAESQAGRLAEAFRDLRDNQLDGLVRFFESSEHVDRWEFRRYAKAETRPPEVYAIAWAPRVCAQEKDAFEQSVRDQGIETFHVFEQGPDGVDRPAFGRDEYFPLLYLEPTEENPGAVGFDLVSDPTRKTAIHHAIQTKLSTATDLVMPFLRPGPAVVLYAPLLTLPTSVAEPHLARASVQEARGVLSIALRLDAILRRTAITGEGSSLFVVMDLYQLDVSQPPRFLGTSSPDNAEHADFARSGPGLSGKGLAGFFVSYPIFAFGKSYVVNVHPGAGFLAAHPVRIGWTAGLVGVLVTMLFTTFVAFLSRHRTALESQVRARTVELRENAQRLERILEITKTGIAIVDAESNLHYVDPGWQRVYGDPTGRKCHEYFFGQDRPSLYCEIPRVLETKEPLVTERVLPREGNRIVEVHVIPFQDAAGQWLVSEFNIDITERKQAEERLRASEVGYRELFNASNEAIFVQNPATGAIVDVNQTMCGMYGFSYQEALQLRIEDISEGLPPYSQYEGMEAVRRALREGPQVFEWHSRRKNGELFWAEVRLRSCLIGGQDRVLASVRDITARIRADEELRQTSEALRALIAASPLAIIVLDTDTQVTLWSPTAERMFGWKAEEVIGRPYPLAPPGREHEVEAAISQVMRGEPLRSVERIRRRKDGSTMYVNLSTAPLRGAGGEIIGVLAILEDIVDRKRAEEELHRHRDHLEELVAERTAQLAEAKEQAEAANKAKSEFLARMSHELRTPMNAILGYTQLMRRDATLSANQARQLDTINRSGEHLLALIDDVLDMAKIEAGRILLHESAVDVRQLLDALKSLFAARVRHKGLDFEASCSEMVPPWIRTDESKLRQVLMNLAGNAVKFTQEGRIALRVGYTEASSPEDGRLVVEVEDTGSGVSQTELSRLFEPFSQGEAGRRTRGGTGLGLVISRRFAELLGGTLTVRSEVGRGSTFVLDIAGPRAEGPPVDGSGPRLPVVGLAEGERPRRIIVADDEPDSRVPLAELLRSVGFEVWEAANGQEVVDLCDTLAPELIWMDIRMPVVDGREATRLVKARPWAVQPVVIALTASAFESDREKLLAVGCDDLVRKPFQEAEIFDRIAKYLGVRYKYEERAVGELSVSRLEASDVVVLSSEMKAELHRAAVLGSIKRIRQLAEAIEAEHGELARKLLWVADEYDFEAIISATRPEAEGT